MTPLRSCLYLALALPIVAATAGCEALRDMEGKLGTLMTLDTAMVARFGQSVNLNAGNSALTVQFVNSAFASLPEAARADTARLVAEFVRDHYAAYSDLHEVDVGFKQVAGAVGFSVTRSDTPYSFRTSDLGPAPPHAKASDSASARQ